MTRVEIKLASPSFDQAETEAVRKVLESGWVVQGPEVAAFEEEIAALVGVKYAIVVHSGTAALHLALIALGIKSGGAVFIPSFAWPSAANMTVQLGARPVLVDVDPVTYNVDVGDLSRQIEQCPIRGWGKPKAIVPVHQFGQSAAMDQIFELAQRHNLIVIEDAACALGGTCKGRPLGSMGSAGIFSFHPRKSISTGEGGAIVTDSEDVANLCRSWRNHGQMVGADRGRDMVAPGFNYRMTDIQAAMGRVQLSKLGRIADRRNQIATQYSQLLAGVSGIALPSHSDGRCWQTYMVVLDEAISREQVIKKIAENGVQVDAGSIAAHCMSVYQSQFGYSQSDLPVSDRLHRQGLALPMHEQLSDADIVRVVECLKGVLELYPTPAN